MLRNVVLLLVVANVLYFAWSHFAANDKPVLTEVVVREKAAEAPPPSCATIGPFQDEALAGMAEGQFRAAGIPAQRRDSTAQINDGWWVYVTSTDSAAQSRAVDTLRRAGMRDAFAMPNDQELRVSVGVFSDEGRAEDAATRVKGLKLTPVIEERHKEQPETWFDVPGMAREQLGDGRLDNLDLPLLDLRIEACPTP
jgi:hypothetical protein